MSDAVIKLKGGQGLLNCMQGCGYTGGDPRVAGAVTAMFAPDYAVAGLSLGAAQQAQTNDVRPQLAGFKAAGGIQLS